MFALYEKLPKLQHFYSQTFFFLVDSVDKSNQPNKKKRPTEKKREQATGSAQATTSKTNSEQQYASDESGDISPERVNSLLASMKQVV